MIPSVFRAASANAQDVCIVPFRQSEKRCASIPRSAASYRLVLITNKRYSITGIENSPPSLMPDGQRDVTVFVRV